MTDPQTMRFVPPRRAIALLVGLLLAATGSGSRAAALAHPAARAGSVAGAASPTGATSAAGAAAAVDPALRAARGLVAVIVQQTPGAGGAPSRALRRLGGRVTRPLPIVDGFAAVLPAAAVERLAAVTGVRALSLDRAVRFQHRLDDGMTAAAAVRASGGSVTSDSAGSVPLRSVYPQAVRADGAWAAGATGRGVTVALVDTGVDQSVPDIAGRVLPVRDDLTRRTVPCLNLSGEPGCADSYGHGTFIAGIIAGNGAGSGGKWKGIAPEADLVSIKIAGRDGSADVSQVLAAIQWVVSFRERYGIEVLNLSLGTDSTQSYTVDPLNYAVERAWVAGITVVVSASNRGPGPGTISKPGDDPFVITAAALDDRGTAGVGDDRLPDFSSRGPTPADGLSKPDVAAPGAHIVSLRAVGSQIDTRFPTYVDGAYRQGSGTSMATGVVSGAAALVAQANPGITPDRVKYALVATTRLASSGDPLAVGAGEIDAQAAALQPPLGLANQGLVRSNGRGALGGSRGSVSVQTGDAGGTVLSAVLGASLTAQLLLWDPFGYTTGDWSSTGWYLTTFYLARWFPTEWWAYSWHGDDWSGSSSYGDQYPTDSYGIPWDGGTWYGAWE
jgi:serine protease AprX